MNIRLPMLCAAAMVSLVACQKPSVETTATTPPPATPETVVTETSATFSPEPGTENARRIDLQTATEMLARGEAVLVDVRSDDAYDTAHAAGAIHIPEAEVVNRIADIPIGKTIITYCT